MTISPLRRFAHGTEARPARWRVLWLVTLLVNIPVPATFAKIVASGFGSYGEAGDLNGLPLTFGNSGNVFELDAFLYSSSTNLNPSHATGSVSLSSRKHPFATSTTISYSSSHQGTGLRITYTLNNAGSKIDDLQFLFYIDAEILGEVNHTDEYAVATGKLGSGQHDSAPDSWEIDEPDFKFGDIYSNLFNGSLDNRSGVTRDSPEDVAMALGFDLGIVGPDDTVKIEILLSDALKSLSLFKLTQHDLMTFGDVLTVSGMANVIRALPGDYDFNREVDGRDLLIWQRCFGSSANLDADGNLDGKVDSTDLKILMDNYGKRLPIHGDYNGDGTVTGRDFLVWQRSYDTTNLAADGNRNQVVDELDLIFWRDRYRKLIRPMAGLVTATTIPEPCTLKMGTCIALMACCLRRTTKGLLIR
jgi:hypothetical protein